MSGAERPDGSDRLVVAITAAGASRRMGCPKPLLPWNGSSLLERMVAAVRSAGLPDPAVVIGAFRKPVSAEVSRVGARALENPDHESGRFSSIRVAARWALACTGHPGLLLWPVDCPGVQPETISILADEADRYPEADIVPQFGNRRGHPIILCRSTLANISQEHQGNLRAMIGRALGGRRVIDVGDPAVLDNLNTPLDYCEFLRRDRGALHLRRRHG